MRIGLLACWPKMRIYPVYSSHLRKALVTLTGNEVPVITTDCMCFHKAHALDENYDYIPIHYFDFPHSCSLDRSHVSSRAKHYAKTEVYGLTEYLRGRAFASRANDFDVVDFQQSSYAFGYESLVSFLAAKSKAKKIITIHKLDAVQRDKPELNRVYNTADGIIVFSNYMKDLLVRDGVLEDKVTVIYHGADLPPLQDVKREQVSAIK